MHALRALALLAPLVWGCAGPSLTTRHHELEDAWQRSAPPPAAADDPFAGARDARTRGAGRGGARAQSEHRRRALGLARGAGALSAGDLARRSDARLRARARARSARRSVDTGAARRALARRCRSRASSRCAARRRSPRPRRPRSDHAAVRLRLATLASLLFDDYYLADALARDERRAPRRCWRSSATSRSARYEAGAASQQDPLEAELEEAELLHREVDARTRRCASRRSRSNALLHRSPELALPPPPGDARPSAADGGRARRAARARARANAPSCAPRRRACARREARSTSRAASSCPTLRSPARYDAFWQESAAPAHRRPRAEPAAPALAPAPRALDEAQAALEQARSERAGLGDAGARSRCEQRARAPARRRATCSRSCATGCCRPRATGSRPRARRFETGRDDFSDRDRRRAQPARRRARRRGGAARSRAAAAPSSPARSARSGCREGELP